MYENIWVYVHNFPKKVIVEKESLIDHRKLKTFVIAILLLILSKAMLEKGI